MADLATDLGLGRVLAAPTMLASGILATSAGAILRVARHGPGAIVTKSVGRDPNPGYMGPNVVEVPGGYLNAMGLPNCGCEAFAKELVDARASSDVPLIASVYGPSPEHVGAVITTLGDGFDAVEVNVSCPHAGRGHGGIHVAQDRELLLAILDTAKDATRRPVLVKLPFSHSLVDQARDLGANGADGIVAINTLPAMDIDVGFRRPVLGNTFGGLSGPAILPVALRAVYALHDAVDIPVIASGGAVSGEDVVKFMLAGASAVQLGTAVAYHGPEVFERVHRELGDYLDANGFARAAELVGGAHG